MMHDPMTGQPVKLHVRDRKGGQPVLASLDAMAFRDLVDVYGVPDAVATRFAHESARYWRPGLGAPVLWPSSPAEAQAMGRCAAHRLMTAGRLGVRLPGGIHPGECRWCTSPIPALLEACEFDTYQARLIVDEVASWDALDGAYVRSTGREGVYLDPEHVEFWAHDPKTREAMVAAAMQADSAASGHGGPGRG